MLLKLLITINTTKIRKEHIAWADLAFVRLVGPMLFVSVFALAARSPGIYVEAFSSR